MHVSVTTDNTEAKKLLTEGAQRQEQPSSAGRANPVVGFVPELPFELKRQKSQAQQSPKAPKSTTPAAAAEADPRLSMDPEHTKPRIAGGFLQGFDGLFSRK
jgi:hypothetical protein